MRRLRGQDAIGLADLARFGASEQVLETTPSTWLPETLPEIPVGKLDVVVGREEHHVDRKHIQHAAEPPVLGIARLYRSGEFFLNPGIVCRGFQSHKNP